MRSQLYSKFVDVDFDFLQKDWSDIAIKQQCMC